MNIEQIVLWVIIGIVLIVSLVLNLRAQYNWIRAIENMERLRRKTETDRFYTKEIFPGSGWYVFDRERKNVHGQEWCYLSCATDEEAQAKVDELKKRHTITT